MQLTKSIYSQFCLCLLITASTGLSGCTSSKLPQSQVSPVSRDNTGADTTRAVALTDKNIDLTVRRGFEAAKLALQAGQFDDARRGFLAITQSHPELSGPHANLGVIYRSTNNLTVALSEFNLAIRLNPNYSAYYNQQGVTYRQLGQFEKARASYEQAITLDANYADAILNLGILYDMYLGDPKRALELYLRYQTLAPSSDAPLTKWIAELKNRKTTELNAIVKEKS